MFFIPSLARTIVTTFYEIGTEQRSESTESELANWLLLERAKGLLGPHQFPRIR